MSLFELVSHMFKANPLLKATNKIQVVYFYLEAKVYLELFQEVVSACMF